jgi:hypothetical protein
MAQELDTARREPAFRVLALWLLASGLWTIATILRVYSVWVPAVGWRRAIEGPWLWVSLVLPPLMFAGVLLVVHLIRRSRK